MMVSGGSGGSGGMSGGGGSMTVSGGSGGMSGGGGSMTVSKTDVSLVGVQMDTSFQCTPGNNPLCCSTMIPPSFLAPDDSTCWQWWDPPASGVVPPGTVTPKGCDYQPCQDAVCACDSYCCDTAWDLSCRGYEYAQGDVSQNNYFVDGCSAKILCCEQESAYPDPPIGGGIAGAISVTGGAISGGGGSITVSKTDVEIVGVKIDTSYQCTPGSNPNCCPTMIPPSFLAPDDSSCWQWWDPPADGVLPSGVIPPKGCNYKPCQDAVCNCDNYCCDTAWDLSCRGYHLNPADVVDNNYFVDGCSAKILCCEPESAYPDPPIGGALPDADIGTTSTNLNIGVNQAYVQVANDMGGSKSSKAQGKAGGSKTSKAQGKAGDSKAGKAQGGKSDKTGTGGAKVTKTEVTYNKSAKTGKR